MKKARTLFLILSLLSCRAALAQDYILDCFHSDDNVERVQFFYNADNLLESYHYISNISGDINDLIDSLYYDERGNVIRINFFQYYENEWIFPSYITYTYDDANHRLTRTNYNDWGSGFELQGVYTYHYDGDLLTGYEMTLDGMPLMRGTYTYSWIDNDSVKQCIEEHNDVWGGTGWSNSAMSTYIYNEAGNCYAESYDYWEEDYWEPESSIEREFDDNGNCLQRQRISEFYIVDRVRFSYDETCSINNVIMPNHPEPGYTWDQFASRPLSYAWETMNDNNQLIYVCDYIFDYKTFEGIPQNDMPVSDMISIYPNPTHDKMTISLEGLRHYEVINTNGQTVIQGQTNGKRNTIDVSGLASGIYLVKAYNGQSWSVCKVQVK